MSHRSHRSHRPRLRMGAKAGVIALAVVALAAPSALGSQVALDPTYNLISNNRVWDFFADPGGTVEVGDGSLLAGSGGVHSDGFDDAVIFRVDGNDFTDADGSAQVSGKTLATGPTTVDDLVVSRADLASGTFLRTTIKLTNPGAATWNGHVSIFWNLGSDGDTGIVKTSNGDKLMTRGDRWSVSHQTTTTADPFDTLVIFGKNARSKPTSVPQPLTSSSGVLEDQFTVSVPESSTRYFVFFTEMNPSSGTAQSSVKKYDGKPTKGMLAGLSTNQKNNTLNWDF